MIRLCVKEDIESMFEIINDAATAYKGIIPPDRYHEPYMKLEELQQEIDDGVVFWGYFDSEDQLLGVMGLQDKGEVALIRHAYVRTSQRNGGIGSKLLLQLMNQTDKPILIGTWEAAAWAIRFYKKNGFTLASAYEKEKLLRTYWSIPDRQIATSVVLYEQVPHLLS